MIHPNPDKPEKKNLILNLLMLYHNQSVLINAYYFL